MITKLLVANRGEIAARVLRTARSMGIATVAVCSDPDRDAPFLAEADEAVPLGGAAPSDTYLNLEAILDAAERSSADAVHPGYGFLAESAELAAGCRKRGLTFVGPPPEVLAALSDKLEAKRVAAGAGVPVLPDEAMTGPSGGDLAAAGERVGFPLVVKATHGGGGIGMRVVRDPDDLAAAVEAARRQAGAAFGSDEVFLERWLEASRHVEVQLLADTAGRMVQLFERECSIQRRHQKLIEEAPSPAVGPALRERLGDAALAVARAVGYVGAGTVEFLLTGEDFWFLEVNARIQVEHPVTEAVTGLDLVRLQLLVAAGEPLPAEVSRAELRGHAIEARLYAEDPAAGFLPQPGTLRRFRVGPDGGVAGAVGPIHGGWGVRVDAGVADGSVVGVHYDPLLAKVIAHAPTRLEATRLLASTLAAARLHGIVTNRDLLVGVLRSEAFLSWETDTAFLDRHPPAELTAAGGSASPLTDRLHAAAVVLAAQAERRATAVVYPAVPSGWRNNPSQLQRVDLQLAPGSGSDPGPRVSVGYRFDRTGTLESLEVDGAPLPGSRLWSCTPDPAHPPGRTAAQATSTWLLDLEVEGVRRRYEAHRVGTTWFVDSSLGHSQFHEPAPLPDGSVAGAGLSAAGGWGSGASPSGSGAARSASGAAPSASGAPPAPGSQLEGLWTADRPDSGDRVRSPTGEPGTEGRGSGTPPAGGATVSPQPGIVRRVEVRVGDRVEVGAVLVVVEAMKTEHLIAATRAGTVRQVLVAEGQEIAAEAMVVEMEEPADG